VLRSNPCFQTLQGLIHRLDHRLGINISPRGNTAGIVRGAGSSSHRFDVGGVEGTFSSEKAKTAQLKMETVLNTQATTVRAQMKDEGNDARICSSAYVVVSA